METQERTTTFFRFEDLRIYDKAVNYTTWVFDATNSLKKQDNNYLIPKFNDAARNIALNIAEGSARNKSQFIYYLKMAKSAIRECLVYTTVTFHIKYIDEEQQDQSRMQLMEMTKMIGALISSLQRSSIRKENTVTEENNNEEKIKENEY
jgi:four helix bundle protein